MSQPKASLVGAGKPRTGDAYVAMDADTGELFAAISLAAWERLATDAKEFEPCVGDCGNPACNVVRQIVKLAAEVES